MIGGILCSPFFSSSPLLAGGFVLGSVLPDLDAMSRCFGKVAFLRCHQTLSHSLIAILAVAGLGWAADLFVPATYSHTWGLLGTGLAIGMAGHVLLDFSNTLGLTPFAPFSWRRRCVEWVFFIDLPVLLVCSVAMLLLWLTDLSRVGVAGSFLVFAAIYWPVRGWLSRAARRRSPEGTVTLVPGPIVPWRYQGFRRVGAGGEHFSVDALSGEVLTHDRIAILDAEYVPLIEAVPEYAAMADLSPAYHVIEADASTEGTALLCRDMRTRPLGTSFGDLEIHLDAAGQVERVNLHV